MGTDGDLQGCMFEAEGKPVIVWDAHVRAQRLMDKDLPNPSEHFAPAALTVPHIPFVVNVVKTTVRHDVVVSTPVKGVELMAKVIPVLANTRTSWNIGRHGVSPSRNHFIKGKGPVSVKGGVISRIPALRIPRMATSVSVSLHQLMQPAPRDLVVVNLVSYSIPPKPSNRCTVGRTHVVNIETVQPSGGDVGEWEAERRMVLEEVVQTFDVL